MKYRIEYRMATPHVSHLRSPIPLYYLYKKGWFWKELIGTFSTRKEAEIEITRLADFQPYHLDYDRYGRIDS